MDFDDDEISDDLCLVYDYISKISNESEREEKTSVIAKDLLLMDEGEYLFIASELYENTISLKKYFRDTKYYIGEKKYTKKDETCEMKDLVEFNRSINDSVKCGIVDSIERFTNNINAGIHSNKEETIMLVKHIVNLWSDKDPTIKEMLMNWNIK